GITYTYDVVAVDSQGNSSLPSPPVTFTVPPPSNASCAVHYALTGSWPGGFQSSVTITDNATAAVDGWTLTWTWPNSGEAVTQMWNATSAQTGTSASATNASYDATIGASGGTVNFGFTGSDSGQAPTPAAFYLNGNVCAND
ncbi:MAG: cellulose binding domain-containing protein, partial [Trebonia sp.]